MVIKRVSIEIDKLTNSIENRITGDNFNTQVLEVIGKDKSSLKKGWNFDWVAELVDRFFNGITNSGCSLLPENHRNEFK